MKKTMLAATLLISNGALAASISVLPPDDKQLVAASDTFTIDIGGLDFTDGSLGGGLDISWDTTLMSLQSVTRTFPGDMTFGSDGTETAGFLQDLSVSSLFVGTMLTEFPIATLEFLLNVGSIETDIAIALGTFTTGAGFNVWVDNNSLAVCDGNANLCDYGGAKINAAVIPVPAAFWLFASALGMLGWIRRRLWNCVT